MKHYVASALAISLIAMVAVFSPAQAQVGSVSSGPLASPCPSVSAAAVPGALPSGIPSSIPSLPPDASGSLSSIAMPSSLPSILPPPMPTSNPGAVSGCPGSDLSAAIAAAAAAFAANPIHDCAGALNGDIANGCMWSVQQILEAAGAGMLGNGSNAIDSAMQGGLSSGQASLVSTSAAKPGDLVVWYGPSSSFGSCEANPSCQEHIGVCLNAGCTQAVANSTYTSKRIHECSFTDFGSALNPQGQNPAFTGSQIIQVNS